MMSVLHIQNLAIDFVNGDTTFTAVYDLSLQLQILTLVKSLQQQYGTAVLFISHDLHVIRYMSNHVAVMQNGRIVEYGETDAVYHHPQHAYTQQLLASVSTIQ